MSIARERTKEEVILRRLFFSLLFALGTGLGAQLRIPLPFTPVPITLQTFFVLSSGVALGPVWGSLSQLFYLLLGIAGFPYFAGFSAGVKTMLGPTGGYLLGFLIASYIVGLLAQKGKISRTYLAMLIGEITILFLGTTWLSFVQSLSLSQALVKGVLPFLPGDAVKILAGGVFATYISHWTKE